MSDDLARLRGLLGASAALWAGSVAVEPGRWTALSGARGVDYNVVLCHGGSNGSVIPRSLEDIAAGGAPGLIMVADRALGEVGRLVEAGWVCVGSVPFMIHRLRTPLPTDAAARRLSATELPAARALVGEVFGIPEALATVALPDDATVAPGRSVWGAFGADGALVCCLALVAVEGAATVWSMATAVAARRQAHGARLLGSALADAVDGGASCSLLHASTEGEPFYRALGYEQLERWQLWSRPRWVLGRA